MAVVGKIPVASGYVTRIENGRIYTRCGDQTDCYSMEFYRVPVEDETGEGGEKEVGIPDGAPQVEGID